MDGGKSVLCVYTTTTDREVKQHTGGESIVKSFQSSGWSQMLYVVKTIMLSQASLSSSSTSDQAPIHPTSKWLEPTREDELTLWEVHRKPRSLIKGKNLRIRCPLKMLNPEFRCVICLQYLKNTTMVMVCLHRFCGECIHKCIRFGMKECPTCRKSIPSRRSLKRDEKFDQIVQNLVGSATEQQLNEDTNLWENQQANRMQRAIQKKQHFVERQKLRSAAAAAAQQPASAPPSNLSSASGMHNQSGTASSLGTHVTITNLQPSPLMEIELRRHPLEDQLDRLERSFLTLRSDAKVSNIKTFLKQKLQPGEFEISSTLDDDSVVLDDDIALIHAKCTLHPNDDRIMVLRYRLTPSTVSTNETSKIEEAARLETSEESKEQEKETKKRAGRRDKVGWTADQSSSSKSTQRNMKRKPDAYLANRQEKAKILRSETESDAESEGVVGPILGQYQEPDV